MTGTYLVPIRWAEVCAAGFILTASTLTYIYGMMDILPTVFVSFPRPIIMSFWLLATWVYIAVIANLVLIRKRNSSIRNRMLLQPVVKPLSSDISGLDGESQVRLTTKHMSECFTAEPFGESHNWHICGVCEVFVPPRTWHCHACRTCIIRRDHHCVFTGCCIGEENHANFLGFMFYLGVGTTITFLFTYIYYIYFLEQTIWRFLLSNLGIIYIVLYDFQVLKILCAFSTVGQFAAWGMFGFHLYCGLQRQTSADAHRHVQRISPGERTFSLTNLTEFLGPSPILRIIWPFHEPLKSDFSGRAATQTDYRKDI